MPVHSPGPILWTFNDLTIYLRASLFFVTFGVRQNRPKTRMFHEKEDRMTRERQINMPTGKIPESIIATFCATPYFVR